MDIFALCRDRFPHTRVEANYSLSRHTTIGCGGTAEAALFPKNTEEAAELLSFFRYRGIPYCFLGAGANTLPPDEKMECALLSFTQMKALYSDEHFFAGAGVTGGELIRYTRERGIAGFEPFTGIPMTVGGATVMNAGVRGGHISDVALRVVGIEKGKIRIFSLQDCEFAEKHSFFQSGIAVTGVYFRREYADRADIEGKLLQYRRRRQGLPKGRSMGCAFVNPAEGSAGQLIDACGLKGRRVGGAVVSQIHANFILNEGGSAADVARLADEVKAEVLRRKGIALREEFRHLTPLT